jgi:hypothetical protein
VTFSDAETCRSDKDCTGTYQGAFVRNMNEQFNSINMHGISDTKTVKTKKAENIHNYKNATDKV